jgi:hypothetical protein
LLVNLKDTLVVVCKGELITITSSSFGSVASKINLNFHLPPAYLRIFRFNEVLKGFKGKNCIPYSKKSDGLDKKFLLGLILKLDFI